MTLLPNTRIQQPGFNPQQEEPEPEPSILDEYESSPGFIQQLDQQETSSNLSSELEEFGTPFTPENIPGEPTPRGYRENLTRQDFVPDEVPKFLGVVPTSMKEEVEHAQRFYENAVKQLGKKHPETKEAWLDLGHQKRQLQFLEEDYDREFRNFEKSGLSPEEYSQKLIHEKIIDPTGKGASKLLTITPVRMLHDLIQTTGYIPYSAFLTLTGNEKMAMDAERSWQEYQTALQIQEKKDWGDGVMGDLATGGREVVSSIGSMALHAAATGGAVGLGGAALGGGKGLLKGASAALSKTPTYATRTVGNAAQLAAGKGVQQLTGKVLSGKELIGIGARTGLDKGAKAGIALGKKMALPTIVAEEAYGSYNSALVEGIDQGLSNEKAHAYALSVGAAAGALTLAFAKLPIPGMKTVSKTVSDAMNGVFGSSFKKIAQTVVGENAEEGSITMSQLALQVAFGTDPDALTAENVSEQLYQTSLRATMGGGLAGGLAALGGNNEFGQDIKALQAHARLEAIRKPLSEYWKKKHSTPAGALAVENLVDEVMDPKPVPDAPSRSAFEKAGFNVKEGPLKSEEGRREYLAAAKDIQETDLGQLAQEDDGLREVMQVLLSKEGGGILGPYSEFISDLPGRVSNETPVSRVVETENPFPETDDRFEATALFDKKKNVLFVYDRNSPEFADEFRNEVIAAWAWNNLTQEDFDSWSDARGSQRADVKGGVGGGMSNVDSFAQSVIAWKKGRETSEVSSVLDRIFTDASPAQADIDVTGTALDENFSPQDLPLQGIHPNFLNYINPETGEKTPIPTLKRLRTPDVIFLMETMTGGRRPAWEAFVDERLKHAAGYFDPREVIPRNDQGMQPGPIDPTLDPTAGVHLNKQIHQDKNPGWKLVRVMMHEIGHLFDYLNSIDWREASQEDSMVNQAIQERFSGLRSITDPNVRNAVIAGINRPGFRESDLRRELEVLTDNWRPWDRASFEYMAANINGTFTKEQVDEAQDTLDYRNSSVELFGDFISVLLNSPHHANQWAPNVTKLFLEHIEKHGWTQKYLEVQNILNGDPDSIAKWRASRFTEMFKSQRFAIHLNEAVRQMEHEDPVSSVINRTWEHFRERFRNEWGQMLGREIFDTAAPLTKYRKQIIAMANGDDAAWAKTESALNDYQRLHNATRVLGVKIQSFVKEAEEMGISYEDLALYMHSKDFLEQKRSKSVAAPAGLDTKTAQDNITWISRKYEAQEAGLSRRLNQHARKFHSQIWVKEVLDPLRASGLISNEKYSEYKRSSWYVPRVVMEKVDDLLDAKLVSLEGTFLDSTGTFDAFMIKGSSLLVAAERNKFRRVLRDALKGIASEQEIQKLDNLASKPPGRMQQLIIVDDGIASAYAISPEISHLLGGPQIETLGKVMSSVGYKMFYPLYITFSSGFGVRNPVRDIRRSWWTGGSYIAGLRKNAQDFLRRTHFNEQTGQWDPDWNEKRVKQETKHIRLTLRDIVKAFFASLKDANQAAGGVYSNPRVLRMLEDRTWTAGYSTVTEQHGSGAMQESYDHIREFVSKEAYNPGEQAFKERYDDVKSKSRLVSWARELETVTEATSRAMGKIPMLGPLYRGIAHLVDVGEAATKLSAQRLAEQINAQTQIDGIKLSKEETKELARTWMGTPNSRRRGSQADLINSLSMFFSTRMANLRAHTELIRNPHSRALHMGFGAGIVFANLMMEELVTGGFLGGALKDWWDALEEGDKDRYTIVPLPWMTKDSDGRMKGVYLKLPKDHDEAAATAAFRHVMRWMKEDDPAELSNLIDIVKDQTVGTWSPWIEVPHQWMRYAANDMPIDSYFNKPLMRDTVFRHGGYKARMKMVQWTIRKLGAAGNPINTMLKLADNGLSKQTFFETVPLLKEFISVTDSGITEDEYKLLAKERERSEVPTVLLRQSDAIEEMDLEHSKLLRMKRADVPLEGYNARRFAQLDMYKELVFSEAREEIKQMLEYADMAEERSPQLASTWREKADQVAEQAGKHAELFREWFDAINSEDPDAIARTREALLEGLEP